MIQKVLDLSKWLTRKIELVYYWQAHKAKIQSRSVLRGSVYVCELGENIGDEKNKQRPVLVVSNDHINRRSGNVVVVALSTNVKLTPEGNLRYRSHYLLKQGKYTFLVKDSVVLCEDVRVVSKARLGSHLGDVDPEDMKRMRSRIAYVMGL